MKKVLLLLVLFQFTACKPQTITTDTSITNRQNLVSISDTTFVNISDFSSDFVLDMKYATAENFLHQDVYGCAVCYLRYQTVKQLINANKAFVAKGYRIKLFDCYRPLDIQKKMWRIVSNPSYVADPAKGSIHNRGGAVDITLVDLQGNELNMGTDFDFFGKEAAHDYQKFPTEIIENRKLLKTVMEQNGFVAFQSEWWHYNLDGSSVFPLANFKWNCN